MRPAFQLSFLLVFPLFLMSCGGNNDSENSVPSDATTPTNSTVSMQRMGGFRIDFDNNGIFEAVAEIEYDASGRVTDVNYTYSDDGTPDKTRFELFSLFGAARDYNATDHYEYDNQGRLISLVFDSELYSRFSSEWEWDENNLATAHRQKYYDLSGNIISHYTTRTLYQGNLVSGFETFEQDIVSGNETLSDSAVINYDAANRPISLNTSILKYNYAWDALGRVEKWETFDPVSNELLTHMTYAYANSRISQINTVSNASSYTETFNYNDAGRWESSNFDLSQDGVIDSTLLPEWEDGVCRPILAWIQYSLYGTATAQAAPYLDGTGYWFLDYCDSYGVVHQGFGL